MFFDLAQPKAAEPLPRPSFMRTHGEAPHHCSPTAAAPFLRPRVPALAFAMKRPGEKADRSTQLARPSRMSSDMALPETGDQRMPQQLWPADM